MSTAINLWRLKIETPQEILRHRFNKLLYGKKKANEIKWLCPQSNFRKKYLKGEVWDFNGIKLPYYKEDVVTHMRQIYLDTLFIFCEYNDNYDSSLVDKLDNFLPEGAYCYKNKDIDVTIKEGDIVIDAGAWIGDFSAYAVQHKFKSICF